VSKGAINQRLKFLVESLSPSVRAFSEAIGDSSSNTNNYVGSRQTEPKPEYLSKVINHFSQVNAHWLLTGNGEPFILPANENNQTTAHAENFFRSPVEGTNHGTAYQENNATPATADTENLRIKLALAEKEVEHLKAQLAMKDALLTSKEETLALLRISFNRPN